MPSKRTNKKKDQPERINLILEPGTKERLTALAGSERKIGEYVSELVALNFLSKNTDIGLLAKRVESLERIVVGKVMPEDEGEQLLWEMTNITPFRTDSALEFLVGIWSTQVLLLRELNLEDRIFSQFSSPEAYAAEQLRQKDNPVVVAFAE